MPWLVRQFLLEIAQRTPGIEFIGSTTVTGVRDPGGASQVALDSTGGVFTADVVVGADGVYSVTRRFVAPGHPAASYVGYMLWRGLVSEADVPGGLGGRGRNLEVHAALGAQLVIYGVPGADGRTDRGHRRVSYAWYDASRTQLLRETGCIKGDTVVGSLRSDQLPAALVDELDRLARRYWPAPWASCIGWGVTHGDVFGTPVAEYLPERLVRDRVVLIGDAAHVATPMTGAGFQNALLDVAALTASLGSGSAAGVPAGLRQYEQERLPRARQLVSSGMSWGRSYVSSALAAAAENARNRFGCRDGARGRCHSLDLMRHQNHQSAMAALRAASVMDQSVPATRCAPGFLPPGESLKSRDSLSPSPTAALVGRGTGRGRQLSAPIVVVSALAAALLFAISSVADQCSTKRVRTRRALSPAILLDLARQPLWLIATATNVAAFVLQVVALDAGSIAVVQPLLVFDLVFGVLIMRLVAKRQGMQRPPARPIFAGVAAAAIGVAGFLAIGQPSAGRANVGFGVLVPLVIGLAGTVGGCLAVAARNDHLRPLALALATGICYGVSAFAVKLVTTEFGAGPAHVFTNWPIYILAVAGPAGFILNEDAFQQGRFLAPVQAIITSADPVISIGLGVLWLGVALRSSPAEITGEVASLLLMTAGIVITARYARSPSTAPAARSPRPRTELYDDPSTAA